MKPSRTDRPWTPRWQRFRRLWRDYQWPILLGLELLLLVLGYRGFREYSASQGDVPTSLDLIYLTIQLVTMESGAITGPLSWQLEVARLLLPVVTAYTAAAAFATLFREQVQRLSLWFVRDHVVICGMGRKGFLLAGRFREQGARVVCIDMDENNSQLAVCRESSAVALVGDGADPAVLRRAAVQRARWLIAFCGDDGVNAEIAVAARQLAERRRGRPLTCIVHIVDPQLCVLLREREITSGDTPNFRLELFNVFDRAARILLREHPLIGRSTSSPPHALVIGLGGLGERLITYAAREWRDEESSAGRRLRITVIDQEARERTDSLLVRYPRLAEVCQLEPLQIDVRSPEFQSGAFLHPSRGRSAVDMVYICVDDDSLALHAALTLHQIARGQSLPIVVRMSREGGLTRLLRAKGDADDIYRNLVPFPLLEKVCTTDLVVGGTHEILAREAHREYVRHQQEMGETAATNPLMVDWESLPERVRESNRRQVDHIGQKLAAVGHGIAPLTDWDAASYRFSNEQVERMAQMEHERWYQELVEGGWRHSAESKSPEKKTHPALLPWDELPEDEREKNRVTTRELPSFLARAGLQVYALR